MSSEDYATPTGRDIMAGELPHHVEFEGITYQCVSHHKDETRAYYDEEDLRALASTIADGEWSVRLYGDWDGPEVNDTRPFSLDAVWIVDGKIQAIVSTVGGGPVGTGIMLANPSVPPVVLNGMHGETDQLIDVMNEAIDIRR